MPHVFPAALATKTRAITIPSTRPRLYITASDVAALTARWDYAKLKAGTTGALASEFATEYFSMTDFGQMTVVLPCNAAMRWLVDPTATYTGDILYIGNGGTNMSFVAANFAQIAMATAYSRIAAVAIGEFYTSDQLYELWTPLQRMAVVYDWCYSETTRTNPRTGNTYRSDFIYEAKRVMGSYDGPGWPDDPHPPQPETSKTFRTHPDLNGHIHDNTLIGNCMAMGLAMYDEDPFLWNQTLALVFGRYKTTMDWWAAGHAGGGDSHWYTYIDQHLLCGLLLKKLGVTDWIPENMKYGPLSWIYAMRPDGRLMKRGDMVDEDGWNKIMRGTFVLAASYFRDDPVYGPLYAYMAWSDKTDFAIGNKMANEGGGAIVGKLLEEDTREDIQTWAFMFLNETDIAAARAFYPGTTGHPHLDSLPLVKFFPAPNYRTTLRSAWADFDPATSPAAIIEINGGTFHWASHQHAAQGTFQIYYKGPLTGHHSIYQSSLGFWGSDPNIMYAKATSSQCGLIVYDPAERSIIRGGTSECDGGRRWAQIPFGTAPQADQPSYLSELFKSYGTNGIDGFRICLPIGHWEHPSGTAAYVGVDMTPGYRSSQSDRVNAIQRRMVAINTGNAACPAILVVCDFIDAKNTSFEKRFLLQCIDTPTMNDGTRTYYFQNNVRPGSSNPVRAEVVGPQDFNSYGQIFSYRGPKFVGAYGGRLTLRSLLPATMTSEFVAYPDGSIIGGLIPGPLKQGTMKCANIGGGTGGLRHFDYGKKGQEWNDGYSWPAGEEGFGRIEIKASGQAKDDFLSVLLVTNAGVAAPTVTYLVSTAGNTIGCRVYNDIVLFKKDGGNIGDAGAGTYGAGITIATAAANLSLCVAFGTWQIKIDGTQVGGNYSVSAAERFLYVASVPIGALTLVLIA